jgi:general secretion pathway protein G
MIHRPTHARLARRSAFTLLEVLIVVAIIVMLAGAGTYYFLQRLEDAKAGRAKADAMSLAAACEQYYAGNNEFPPSLDALTQPQPNGNGAFFGPDKLLDPWRKPYQYDPQGPNNAGNKPDVWTTHPRTGIMIGNW